MMYNIGICLLLIRLQINCGWTDVGWLLWAWLQPACCFRACSTCLPFFCICAAETSTVSHSFEVSQPPKAWPSHAEVQGASPSGQAYSSLCSFSIDHMAMAVPNSNSEGEYVTCMTGGVGNESSLNTILASTLPKPFPNFSLGERYPVRLAVLV